MRRLSNSSLPASVSKNHWPSFFTMGTGKGQKFVAYFEHALGIRFAHDPVGLVECRGERVEFVGGLNPIRVFADPRPRDQR